MLAPASTIWRNLSIEDGGIGGYTFGTLVVASDFPFNKMVAQTSGDNSGIAYGWWITTVYIFDQALQRSNEIRKRQPPTT